MLHHLYSVTYIVFMFENILYTAVKNAVEEQLFELIFDIILALVITLITTLIQRRRNNV